jgi:predicted RNA-binding protein with PIN domain
MLSVKDIETEMAALEEKRAREVANRDRAVQAILQCDGALMLARHLLAKSVESPAGPV